MAPCPLAGRVAAAAGMKTALAGRFQDASPGLRCLEIGCRLLAALGDDIEADPLTFGQRAHARLFHRTDVHEHILAAAFGLDETEALGGVEPLYCTCLLIAHVTSFLKLKMGCARLAPEIKKKVTERNSNSAAIFNAVEERDRQRLRLDASAETNSTA